VPSADDPARFYTGLVADLYEPLAGDPSQPDDYVPFLDAAGSPALELACGAGTPMLELIQRGYEIEGVDSSPDMLDHCRRRASDLGLEVVLYEQEMQRLALPRRYRAIFLAGASFTLLPSDAAARETLRRMHEHLMPGGSVLIPLSQVAPGPDRQSLPGTPAREVTGADGVRLSVEGRSVEIDRPARTVSVRLRYERSAPGSDPEIVERDWHTRWWTQPQFRALLEEAGFERITAVGPTGGRVEEDALVFAFLAQRTS
jgi:SAM-dependent methyltransferase